MSAEVSLYETEISNIYGDTILVDTKDVYLNGENYLETQVFIFSDDIGWELVDVVSHKEDTSLAELKSIHDRIVNQYKHQKVKTFQECE